MPTSNIRTQDDAITKYRRWLGITNDFQVQLERTYPTLNAAIEAMEYGDFVARRDAIRVLGAMGEHDLVLKYAMIERESSWIPVLACDILVSPPLGLLIHWVTKMKPSGDGSHLSHLVAYQLPKFNYTYLQNDLALFFAKEKRRVAGFKHRHLDAIGAAGLTSMQPLLARYLEVKQLRTYKQALDSGIDRKQCRASDLSSSDGYEHRYLDHESSCAVSAAVALSRMGFEINQEQVRLWLEQLAQVFDLNEENNMITRDYLETMRWLLFHAGDDAQFDALLAQSYVGRTRHDIALTLLKRGDHSRFDRWLKTVPKKYPRLVHPPSEFYFWPLIDHLEARGISRESSGQSDGYILSRIAGVAPPTWWQWESTLQIKS